MFGFKKIHRMKYVSFILFLFVVVVSLPQFSDAGVCNEECIDFEDLVVKSKYYVGDSFVSSQSPLTVEQFQWSNGVYTTDGFVQVDNSTLAGGSGLEMWINNANLSTEFDCIANVVTIRFGEYGGNINLDINGDFQNFSNFEDIDGTTIGGALVSVINGGGNDQGWLRLEGNIAQLSIGGQELWIDDICPEGECIEFEDPALNTQYNVGDSFVDSNTTMTIDPFQWSNGIYTSNGFAYIDNGLQASGSGQELFINNANISFGFQEDLCGLSFLFGEYGGNINMEINGDFRNFLNFQDVDGVTIGGTSVSVLNGNGNDHGILEIKDGTIQTFAVGGQELYLDHVCPLICQNAACVNIPRVWPVYNAKIELQSTLWAEVTNNCPSRLPQGSKVWFYVTGPDWMGSHWVGSSDVSGLETGKSQWYSCQWTVPSSATPGMYSYWAQVWDSEKSLSDWSERQDFVVAGKNTPGTASLLNPKGTVTQSSPSFIWNTVSDSSWYHLWIEDASGKVFSKWYRAEQVYDQASGICRVTPARSLSAGDYTWWIRTWNVNGYGPWSSRMDFTVQVR